MTFVREKISEEDWEKSQISELDKRWHMFAFPSISWCIDREKDIWLRLLDNNPPSYADYDPDVLPEVKPKYWDFYWKGTLLLIATKFINYENNNPSSIKINMELVGLDVPDNIKHYRDLEVIEFPKEIIMKKAEIINDLIDALMCDENSTRSRSQVESIELILKENNHD